MSVRETILDNLEDALKGIKTSAGYNCDIGTVTREASSSIDFDSSRSPAIMIVDDGGEIREAPISTDQRVTATISLEGFVRSNADLSEKFNDLLADIRKCIHAASLGDNVIYQRFGNLETFTGEDRILFVQELEILYYYSEASP